MSFKKLHQPCPECGSSDAVSINEDNSGWCFSCLTRIPDYYNTVEEPVIEFSKYKNNIMKRETENDDPSAQGRSKIGNFPHGNFVGLGAEAEKTNNRWVVGKTKVQNL